MADILVEAGATIIADEDRMAKLLCTVGFKNEIAKLKYLVKCEVDLEVAGVDSWPQKRNVFSRKLQCELKNAFVSSNGSLC